MSNNKNDLAEKKSDKLLAPLINAMKVTEKAFEEYKKSAERLKEKDKK